MVAISENIQNRLTIQTVEIAPNTTAIRSLDWDRDRFDIEFGLQNGTTYNSYLIRGEQTVLIDTSHQKFRDLYLDTLKSLVNPKTIDYIIVSHTEPDHSGLVEDVLQLAPRATVLASKVALQFLEGLVHEPFSKRIVKSGDRIKIGQDHEMEFVSAPNLHWPDTIFSFDRQTQILYTCDAFGMHFCDDRTFDEDLEAIEADFRFYYDCLMGPNARSLLNAMKRMGELGKIKIIANGHGPLLHHNLDVLTEYYHNWSQKQTKTETTVGLFYVSGYGYSDRLGHAIGDGLQKAGVGVEVLDLSTAESQEIQELAGRASGLIVGMPSTSTVKAQAAISSLLAVVKNKQVVGLFESYGGNDEPIDTLRRKFIDLGIKEAFSAIRIKETPTDFTYQQFTEAGIALGQLLVRERNIKQIKSLDVNMEKALGRISNGLYIVTAKKGDISGAMIASWVTQASLQPLGFTIAVAKDRALDNLLQLGDRFVLNVLEEGNYQDLKKHFLKRLNPDVDRFAEVKTQIAKNGSPILTDALAYMECEVVNSMECSDHWILYCTIADGKVSKPDGITAVRHRKVGNYY
ncbi:MAG: diflavin flavoprotein [Aphanizomenon sp.]|jgi:flavorubredoxin/flavin reductase (DIM6/NTAB) family NADH-FMN oxidoreductase RutF|uniref:Diflavin flavoprotein A n=2 Tax=Aphanizomenon flos-aquae TaxID=1176 RepID=A0A1B7X2Q3_APHFL|nr:MBL fold metallo-hydrolase [Aphanizomenon flos-aquae UKL13-PB]MBO1061327.1 MBL fold metallo-hydrolase [Aphanizomenon flos-aquae CP01]NTW18859.1 MBL fold metallo-hydrolase [Nostocales cyanobacterium W4_Combined_metabat2_030]OBQ25845.1 MAG: diflavin flavoprotein A [Aphanizomenon flos-aquae LD13]OBQ43656.1 MAG: diflavin flavoprotein A [Aphanizomenon flos-aquae WA102]HCQ22517.1 diflavin flavoprotein A [Anabaena sp. UBA12330]